MEETQQIVIPTLSKAKISRYLSYPIGAEHISEALASVPQFAELKLLFYSSKFHTPLRRGDYEFLRVEYLEQYEVGREVAISVTEPAVCNGIV